MNLVEAEWRLSANDHHHHSRCHHHHHHHHCLVWSYMFFLLNSSPQRQLPRLLITGLSFCTSGGSLFFFLRPASSLDVAMDHNSITQYNQAYDQKHFIHISKSNYFLLQDSGKKVNRPRAALAFTPSHEVLQELSGVKHCRPISHKD